MAPVNCEELGGYSRSEWGSLPIQERIRAVAEVDSKTRPDKVLPETSAGTSSIDSESNGARRVSVIEMWRQREAAAAAGKSNAGKPARIWKATSERTFQHHEEKKEPTPEEDNVHGGSDPGVGNQFSPRAVVSRSSFAAGDSADSRKWSRTSSVPQTTLNQSVSTPPSKPQIVVSPPSSVEESTPRNPWNSRESDSETSAVETPSADASPAYSATSPQAPREYVKHRWSSAHETANETSNAPGSPIAPNKGNFAMKPAAPVTPDAGATADAGLPAFSDLKSKWAKFGASKIQAREESKLTPGKLSLLNASHTTAGEESASLDGDCASHETPESPPTGQDKNAVESLQQPDLDADINNSSRRPGGAIFSKQDLAKKFGQASRGSKPSPAAQVATYMYVKAKPAASQNGPADSKITGESSSPSRLNPKKFAQRKLLMDKHRKKSKEVPGSPAGSSGGSVSSGNSDELLNQALHATVPEKQQQHLSSQMMQRVPDSGVRIGPDIPMKTFMDYGADEDEFIGVHFGPGPLPHSSGFKSLIVSELNAAKSGKKDTFRYGDPLGWRAEEHYDGGRPQQSRSSSAQASMHGTNNKTGVPSVHGMAFQPMYSENLYPSASLKGVPNDYGGEEMMYTGKKEQRGDTIPRSSRVTSRPNQPPDEFRTHYDSRTGAAYDETVRNSTFDESASVSTASYMVSTITSAISEATSVRDRPKGSKARAIGMPPEDIVTDEFVSESNTNVDAFKTSFQSLSFQQIANDLKEEAGSVLNGVDFKKLSTDFNQGVAAASQTLTDNMSALSRFVGTDVLPKTKRKKKLPKHYRMSSPVEEIAIEVEYVEDS